MTERSDKDRTYPTAVSAEGAQEAVDCLDGTENHLDSSYDQQDGEEGQIPGNHIGGLVTLVPQGIVTEIVPTGNGEKEDVFKSYTSP